MNNSEQQIGLVENISNYPDTYNLFWMDKRLVVIHTRSQSNVGVGLIPSLIGEGITKFNESRKKEKTKDLTLDEILAKDKKSFAVDYTDVEKIELHDPHSRWRNRKLKIKMQLDTVSKDYIINESQFEKLSTILPKIVELRAKLVS